ncbi:MAG: RnfABCDGE type electron transport complex subunit G [Candidatus Omnitrophota bacterium]
MAQKQSSFFHMVTALFVIALVGSASVGGVYELTKEPIAQARMAKKVNAVKEVVPEFNNNPIDEEKIVEIPSGVIYIYPAKKDGQFVGAAVEALSNKGFGGAIRLMVGFQVDGTIQDIVVLEHKETPGLGDKMEKSKSDFASQFKGKNPANFNMKVTKDGGDVDAITAATISSRAFIDAVQQAYQVYEKEIKP